MLDQRPSDKRRFQGREFLASWQTLSWIDNALEVVGLDFKYDNGPELFTELTFHVPARHVSCLFGPNGIGKTTLFNLISGALPGLPSEAQLIPCAYMIQDFHLSVFPWLSVPTNLQMPHAATESIEDVWARAKEMAKDCPAFGPVITWKQKPAATLSGGQKQLLALFRAMLSRRPLILLDEPFSSIDLRTRSALMRQMRRWTHETSTAVFCCLHSLDDALLFADSILLMSQTPSTSFSVFPIETDERTIDWLGNAEASQLRATVFRELQETACFNQKHS